MVRPALLCLALAACPGLPATWAITLATTPAAAQGLPEGTPDAECHGITFEDTAFCAATVAPGQARLPFRAAPAAAAPQGRAFLVPGDVVVLTRRQDGFGCASFLDTAGRATSGWLPMPALRPLPPAATADTPAAWEGGWYGEKSLDQEIRITRRGGAMRVEGTATWGGGDPGRVRRGGISTGALQGEPQLRQGRLAFAHGDAGETLAYEAGDPLNCRARLLRLGPYLAVQDNLRCGGMNVTFGGLYRRAARG